MRDIRDQVSDFKGQMKSSNEDKLFCSLLTIIFKAFQEILKKIGGKPQAADDIKADRRLLPLADRLFDIQ